MITLGFIHQNDLYAQTVVAEVIATAMEEELNGIKKSKRKINVKKKRIPGKHHENLEEVQISEQSMSPVRHCSQNNKYKHNS